MRDNFTVDEAENARLALRSRLSKALGEVVEIHDSAFRDEPWFVEAQALNAKMRTRSLV